MIKYNIICNHCIYNTSTGTRPRTVTGTRTETVIYPCNFCLNGDEFKPKYKPPKDLKDEYEAAIKELQEQDKK